MRAPTPWTASRIALPSTAAKPLTRSTSWPSAAAEMRSARAAGSIGPASTAKLSKSSWSWSSSPSWCEGRASMSSSAAAFRPSSRRASTAPPVAPTVLTAGERSPSRTWASTPAHSGVSRRSRLLTTTRSAAASWSSNSSSSGASWSRAGSARRAASTSSGSAAKRPAETAAASTTATTPSTVVRERTSGQAKACTSGFGNARPEVSMMIWSGGSGRSRSACMVGRKSSATVQQMHPLASSTISSSSQPSMPQARSRSPSMPRSPNSLTTIARRRPAAFSSRWRTRLVLPAPRKPVTTVAGIFGLSMIGAFRA